MVIDRVGVYLVKSTNTYSKNGAFYRSVDENGNPAIPRDELSQLPPGVSDQRIRDHLSDIRQCQGTFAQLQVPPPA